MRIDTPQILWHNDTEGNGKAAPLYSVSLLPHPPPQPSPKTTTPIEILATAGNNNDINLWKLSLPLLTPTPTFRIVHNPKQPPITHHLTLTRHERSINALSFSPRGTHLATAGDGGSLLLYSVPHPHRSSSSHEYWRSSATLKSENDLVLRVVPTHAEDVMDVDWSGGETRLVVGTLDHSVVVFENCGRVGEGGAVVDEWECVWRDGKEHTQYVQGVRFDPVGVYLASQGSDRTVRVWTRRKSKGKGGGGKKKVLGVVDRNVSGVASSLGTSANGAKSDPNWLDGKFELMPKPKVLKYIEQRAAVKDATTVDVMNDGMAVEPGSGAVQMVPKKLHLFADEGTVGSFFRRLAWTIDGAFLITPASIYQGAGAKNTALPTFAVYLFARHHFTRPYKVLSGMDKPAIVVRPNPVLFQLPAHVQTDAKENTPSPSLSPSPSPSPSSPPTTTNNNTQQRPSPQCKRPTDSLLPYRSIFAVLTLDTVLIYDTYHPRPLCIARGLHYTGLTDCTWSSDGRNLTVCSTDGYISILSFEKGELGEVYTSPHTTPAPTTVTTVEDTNTTTTQTQTPPLNLQPILPPCSPGQTAQIIAPPSKKARTIQHTEKQPKRVTPMLLSPTITDTTRGIKRDIGASLVGCTTPTTEDDDRSRETVVVDVDLSDEGGDDVEREVLGGVTNLSLQQQQKQNRVNVLVPVRKKKRVQPTLLTGNH